MTLILYTPHSALDTAVLVPPQRKTIGSLHGVHKPLHTPFVLGKHIRRKRCDLSGEGLHVLRRLDETSLQPVRPGTDYDKGRQLLLLLEPFDDLFRVQMMSGRLGPLDQKDIIGIIALDHRDHIGDVSEVLLASKNEESLLPEGRGKVHDDLIGDRRTDAETRQPCGRDHDIALQVRGADHHFIKERFCLSASRGLHLGDNIRGKPQFCPLLRGQHPGFGPQNDRGCGLPVRH